MAQKRKKSKRILFRVFSNAEGEVLLQFESGGESVPVKRPVTPESLNDSKRNLLLQTVSQLRTELGEKDRQITPKQATANKEIEAALDPIMKGRWLNRAEYAFKQLQVRELTVLFSLMLIALASKGVKLSSERLPEKLHFIVLGLFIVGLGFLVAIIATEENRIKYREKLVSWFGPRAMLVLPLALLGATSSVMASLTFRLYSYGKVALDTCSGRPVTEAGLMDFYVWHFFNIVPLLQLNSLIRWGEPYCYKQSRVGFLILVFQLLVVIPSFNAIRFYWRNRKIPSDYVFDPHWNPEAG